MVSQRQLTNVRMPPPFAFLLVLVIGALAAAVIADYSLTITTTALVLLGFAVFNLAAHTRIGVFSPVVVMGGLGVLYGLPFALTKAFGGTLIDERTFADDHVDVAIWLHAVFIASLLVAYVLTRSHPNAKITFLTKEWP